VSGWDLQVAACARFHDAGHATPIHDEGSRQGYVHGLGHGVGYELHELPSFARGAGEEGTLAEGDVFTLEPGLYEPDAGWGVRVENLLLMGARRAETLTPLPYDLDPRAWETI
jgi:Xaa-Pro aminopeptidase